MPLLSLMLTVLIDIHFAVAFFRFVAGESLAIDFTWSHAARLVFAKRVG